MTAIILLGPPGSGKGTVSEALLEKGYTHISTGEFLREQIRLETHLGIEAKKLMNAGKFVPDGVVVGMIKALLKAAPPQQKFLFDGFPRTLFQGEKLDLLLHGLGGSIEEVILLECSDDIIIERLSGRRTCGTCGTVYHLKYNPPAVQGICDTDDGKLIQRPDDNAETIKKRLNVYTEQTAPLIDYYRAQNLLYSIDATQPIEAVRSAVLNHEDLSS